jgi:putative oligomerization/nucleic acid binding protein
MPLMRRRPLLRAAMVGGTAYAAGKHVQRGQQHEAEQDQQLAATQQAPPPPPPPMAAAPAPAPSSAADRVSALTDLKGLLDSGVLTQQEFDAEKSKILAGG